MSLADLPTLAEVYAARRGKPLTKGPSRLELKETAEQTDEKALEKWRRDVRKRDKGRCRACGVKTIKTPELDAKRGETHHIVGRADKAVRHDRRNGLHVCYHCHEKLTKHHMHVVAKASQMFRAENGRSYINGDKPVKFKEHR